MSTAQLSPYPKLQFFDDNGRPLAGGLLYSYVAGTSTPLPTYTTAEGTVANSNPVVLDSAGRAQVWLAIGVTYKLILKKAIGSLVWSVDGIGGTQESLVVSSISALRSLAGNAAKMSSVLGYYAPGDFGGGTFYWDSSSNESDNAGTIIKPANYNGTGRWKRIVGASINVKDFGAKGDNANNDTAAVIAAGTYATANNKCVSITTGNYLLTYNPNIKAQVIFGSGAIIRWQGFPIYLSPVFSDYTQHFNPSGSATAVLTGIDDILPEWFGALGDATKTANNEGTDDTTAIQYAISSASAGQTIVFTAGKKYRCGRLSLTAGVNLRGSAPVNTESNKYRKNLLDREATPTLDITEREPEKEYLSTLQFNGTSGDYFLTLFNSSAGGIAGVKISGLIIDGNQTANFLIGLNTTSSVVENCMLRNAANGVFFSGNTVYSGNNVLRNCTIYGMTSYGIYNTGAYSIDGTISGNTFFDCVYGIVLENPQGWTISVNNFEMCSTACISISGSGYIIDRNVFDDIKTTGINVVNSGTRGSVISCNTITAMSHDSVTGILITSSAAGHINVTGNTLYCNKEGILTDTNDTDGLTYCKGVKTVNSGAALPGDIIDNIIVDFATPYTIADSTTIVRYIDYDTNRNTPTLKTTPDRIDGTTLSVVSSGSRPEGNIIAGRGSICFYNATDNVARQVYIKTTAKSSSPIICAYGSSVISGASIFGATLNNTASGLLWYTYNNNTFNLYKSKGTAEGDLVATATYSGNTTLALKKKNDSDITGTVTLVSGSVHTDSNPTITPLTLKLNDTENLSALYTFLGGGSGITYYVKLAATFDTRDGVLAAAKNNRLEVGDIFKVTSSAVTYYNDYDAGDWGYFLNFTKGAAWGWVPLAQYNDSFQFSNSSAYKLALGNKDMMDTLDKDAQLSVFRNDNVPNGNKTFHFLKFYNDATMNDATHIASGWIDGNGSVTIVGSINGSVILTAGTDGAATINGSTLAISGDIASQLSGLILRDIDTTHHTDETPNDVDAAGLIHVQLTSYVNNKLLIESVGSKCSSDRGTYSNFINRKYLTRTGALPATTVYNGDIMKYGGDRSTSDDAYGTVNLHDCIGIGEYTTPGATSRTWYERRSADGSHHFGDEGTEIFRANREVKDIHNNVTTPAFTVYGNLKANSLSLGDGTSTLKFSGLTDFGVRTAKDCTANEIVKTLKYQKTSGVTTVRIPEIIGTSASANSSAVFRIFPSVIVANQIYTSYSGSVIFSATSHFSITVGAGLEFAATGGDQITLVNGSNFAHCYTHSYNSTTGALDVTIEYKTTGQTLTGGNVYFTALMDATSKLYLGSGFSGTLKDSSDKYYDIVIGMTDVPYDTWIAAEIDTFDPVTKILTYKAPTTHGLDSKHKTYAYRPGSETTDITTLRFYQADLMRQYPFFCINDGNNPDRLSVNVCYSDSGTETVYQLPGTIKINTKYMDVERYYNNDINPWAGSPAEKGIYAQTFSFVDAGSVVT